jgi:hypothetical protein
MKAEQPALGRALAALTAELTAIDGGRADLRFGFVTPDVGADGNGSPSVDPMCRHGGDLGLLQAGASCGVQGRFVSWRDGGRQKNFGGTLEGTLGCLTETIGAMGCRLAQPLYVAAGKSNPDDKEAFVRMDANLLIVIVSNYDDCSAGPMHQFYGVGQGPPMAGGRLRCALDGHICNSRALDPTPFQAPLASCSAKLNNLHLMSVESMAADVKARKRAPYRTLVGVVAGWPENPATATYAFANQTNPADGTTFLNLQSVCNSSRSSSEPALRLKAFADAFGADGTVQNLCSEDLRPSFTRIGQLARAALRGP